MDKQAEIVNKKLPQKDDLYILNASKTLDRTALYLLFCLSETKKSDGEYMNKEELIAGYKDLSNMVKNIHETPKNITPKKNNQKLIKNNLRKKI